MITETKDIELVKPMFEKYMWHMSQYFSITDYDSWYNNALEYLYKYRSEHDRHIHLISNQDQYIGFCFTNEYLLNNKCGKSISEFYILKHYQRSGYGSSLAKYVINRFHGPWEIRVTEKNKNACVFWHHVISEYTCGSFQVLQQADYDGDIFVFDSA